VKTPHPIPNELERESNLIRHFLANERSVMRAFPIDMENRFWLSLADRSLGMIRNQYFNFMLGYIGLGLLTFPTVFFVSSLPNREHDLIIWLLAYGNGFLCLGALGLFERVPVLVRHYQSFIGFLTFFGVLNTCILTLSFAESRLSQQGSYIIIFVYMLVYFLSGVRPRLLLLVCGLAGILPLFFMTAMGRPYDELMYFYAVIVSNCVGFMLSYLMLGKDRISFLQGRLLEIDKIRSSAMREELTRLSQEDAVTGLSNRRYFNETIASEWDRAERSSEPLSLLFIDVDHFKAYNDTYGHLQGDDALIQVANILKSHLRRSADMAARYGGEEFVLLLPNTPLDGARVVAEKLLAAVDRLRIEHLGSHTAPHVTISIGVTTWQPDKTRSMSPNRLIDQADSAVYQAKAAGRHCVRVFGVE
jgi:diguanylate cyclase (GGDEF)-like protein